MKKNFMAWHKEKEVIDNQDTPELYYAEGEVWWMRIGYNVGSEQTAALIRSAARY